MKKFFTTAILTLLSIVAVHAQVKKSWDVKILNTTSTRELRVSKGPNDGRLNAMEGKKFIIINFAVVNLSDADSSINVDNLFLKAAGKQETYPLTGISMDKGPDYDKMFLPSHLQSGYVYMFNQGGTYKIGRKTAEDPMTLTFKDKSCTGFMSFLVPESNLLKYLLNFEAITIPMPVEQPVQKNFKMTPTPKK